MSPPVIFDLQDPNVARTVFGHRDEFVRLISDELAVDIHVRGERVTVDGDPLDAACAREVIQQLYGLVQRGYTLTSMEWLDASFSCHSPCSWPADRLQ